LHVDTATLDFVADVQNLTIRLPAATVRKAKLVATERGTSISALVAEKIEEIVGEERAYDAARRHALRLLERGYRLGGRRIDRDALHER